LTTGSAARRFFRTPKGLLIIVFAILVAVAAPSEGIKLVIPGLTSAIIVAALIDVLVLRRLRNSWEFPSGAVLTGLIVAMILTPREPWYVAACTSVAAIVSKYFLRTRAANVFNPAALALVLTFYIFNTGQSWWGAMPDAAPLALIVLFVSGAFIADRVNKIPLVLIFLGVYFALFTLTAFLGNPGKVAEVFRAPDLHAVLFFAFFILTDPPTSPVKYADQFVYGVIVAIVSYAIFEMVGAAYYLLAGVLVGNIWEAWHRWQTLFRRRPPVGTRSSSRGTQIWKSRRAGSPTLQKICREDYLPETLGVSLHAFQMFKWFQGPVAQFLRRRTAFRGRLWSRGSRRLSLELNCLGDQFSSRLVVLIGVVLFIKALD